METFPAGVLSPNASIGVSRIITAHTEIVAIELKTGAVLWRQLAVGIPVAATNSLLVVLETATEPELKIFDLESGKPYLTIQNTGLPAWVSDIETRPGAMIFLAKSENGELIVNWALKNQFAGGASPSDSIESPNEATGSLRINLRTGKNEIIVTDSPAHFPHLEANKPPIYTPLNGEVSRKHVGDFQYVLRAERSNAGKKSIKLDALDKQGKTTIWETTLGEIEQTMKPSPLRK